MATYSVARAKHAALTANTVDTVNLSSDVQFVVVVNRTGTAEISFTTDGSTPTVGGDDTYVLPASICSMRVTAPGTDQVKLKSSGTPSYSVMADLG